MNEIIEYFRNLTNPAFFPARWMCGRWSAFHGWLYILSSVAIWAAYFAIPIIIYYFLRKRSEDSLPFKKVFFLFMLFILACGITHLFDALMFWYPVYRLSALVLLITAAVSWATVYGLIRVMPEALQLKSPYQSEQIIHERTLELQESNARLIKLNNDLDNFTYLAAHDVKAPINNLEGLLDIIKSEAESQNLPEPEVLQRAQLSLEKVKGTITHLINVIKLDKNPFDDIAENKFEEVLKEVIGENEIMIKSAKARIVHNFDVPGITYSKTALKSIIYNLVTNSIKYASPHRAPLIELKTELIYGRTMLSIKDNGLGMDLKNGAGKIFSLFKRLHDHVEGAGVGLYVVKKIITDKKGTIEVKSSPDAGAIFEITF